jgi:ABC-type Fe3+/spermidine/putrescine transport system ATPase subunit
MSSTVSTEPQAATRSYLSVNNIEVIYDHVILVLKGVSLEVPQGRIVALLGANGAGKTTTLKAISNLLRAERGEVTKGTIEFDGKRVDRLTPNDLVRMGVCQVMEGRHCFQHLTVEENLLTGAFTQNGTRAELKRDLDLVYTYFPAPQGAARQPGRVHLGRRAADDGDRPRADGAAEDDPARRAVDGSRAAAGRGDLRDRPQPERQGARVVPARGAEHDGGAALRGLRLHPRERPRS